LPISAAMTAVRDEFPATIRENSRVARLLLARVRGEQRKGRAELLPPGLNLP